MSDLHALAAPARVALWLLSLAARPLPAEFPTASVEVVRISRRDLHRLAVDAGFDVGLHAFNAALADLDEGAATPALRVITHARSVHVDIGLLALDDDADEAWLALLPDEAWHVLSDAASLPIDLDDAGAEVVDEVRASLAACGLDVTTPLSASIFSPSPGLYLPAARRCSECNAVKTADHFLNNGARLLSTCRACTPGCP